MKLRNLLWPILFFLVAIWMCTTQKKEANLNQTLLEKDVYITQLETERLMLQDSLETYELNNVTVSGESENLAQEQQVRIVYKTDYRTATELKRLRERYNKDIDTLSKQRDSALIQGALLEAYCVNLQEQNDSTMQALTDSLTQLSLPWHFTQEDPPWYVLDMFVESPDSAYAEFFYTNENIVDLQKIKKNFWQTITFKPRRYRTKVTPMNPYSVQTQGHTYYFDKVKPVKE